jgi:tetratricopeptide (TPR) repeat protein
MLMNLGFVAASGGRRREAVADFSRAHEEALQSGDSDFADLASLYLAGILLELDDPTGSAACLRQMKGDGGDPGTVALFWANLGNPVPAQRLIARIVSSGTRSSLSLYYDLPEARSILALEAHKPALAVQEIEPARKYQMRDPGVPYQRARAEVEAGMFDQAAADYRLILANPGIDPVWPDYTLTHLRLARVLVLQKKFAEARTEYQAFLGAWKDADPGLPTFETAKSEFAQLHD